MQRKGAEHSYGLERVNRSSAQSTHGRPGVHLRQKCVFAPWILHSDRNTESLSKQQKLASLGIQI